MINHYLIRARDLIPGDLVDLAGDKYADRDSDSVNHIVFKAEYGEVASVELETPYCVAVMIEGVDLFGFPPEHMLRVLPESRNGKPIPSDTCYM